MNFINLLYIVKFGKTKNVSNKYILNNTPEILVSKKAYFKLLYMRFSKKYYVF